MNSLKSLATNRGPLSENDPRPRAGESLACSLEDRLDVSLGHLLADFPVNDEPTVAVEEAAEILERPGNVDVRDINVASVRAVFRADRSLFL